MEHYTLCRKCSEQHKERVIHQMPECTDKIDWKARAEKAEAKLQAVMQWKVDNDRKIDENASLDLYALLTE